MTRRDPQPVTITDSLLAQVRDELRTLNERLGGAEPSGPAVADGVTVTERPPANVEHGDQPEPLAPPPGQSADDRASEGSGPDLPEPDYDMAHSLAGGSYSCPECPRSFTTQSGLSRHRTAKHRDG